MSKSKRVASRVIAHCTVRTEVVFLDAFMRPVNGVAGITSNALVATEARYTLISRVYVCFSALRKSSGRSPHCVREAQLLRQ